MTQPVKQQEHHGGVLWEKQDENIPGSSSCLSFESWKREYLGSSILQSNAQRVHSRSPSWDKIITRPSRYDHMARDAKWIFGMSLSMVLMISLLILVLSSILLSMSIFNASPCLVTILSLSFSFIVTYMMLTLWIRRWWDGQ